MPTHRTSIQAAIRDRIHAPSKPRVWMPDDFADQVSRSAVDLALHRLVAANEIRRIARGLYDAPTRIG